MIFRVVPVNTNKEVLSSVFLRSSLSGRVIDVPAATADKGAYIIQYRQNYRFNQRWQLIKLTEGYLIQNMRSKLYLDI